MKNKLLTLLFYLLYLMGVKAQTCTTPILLDTYNSQFTPLDSFNVQNQFLKFTANNFEHTIKIFVKRLSTYNGNIYVNVYLNNCASLGTNQLNITPIISGDSITIINNFMQGAEYLVELGKTVSNLNYISYNMKVNNTNALATWSCPPGGFCTINPSCELVCNGSFENTNATTTFYSQIVNANNWNDANGGTSDLLTAFATNTIAQTPCNIAGHEIPYSSTNCTQNSNYAGILSATSPTTGNYAEYIQTKLTSTLTAGKTYVISFWVSKAENYSAVLNSLGVYLTQNPISAIAGTVLPNTPNVIINAPTALNNNTGWTQLKTCFIATGNESYLTIGMPVGTTVTSGSPVSLICGSNLFSIYVSNPQQYLQNYHYLYIDDVSVKPFEITATSNTPTVNVCGTVNLNAVFSCTNSIGPLGYTWSGGGISNSVIANPTAFVNGTSNFFVSVSNGSNCIANSNITIFTTTVTAISITPSAFTVCPNSPVIISASLLGGSSTFTFLPGTYIGNNPTFTPSVETTYTILGTNASGCVQGKTITINVFNDILTATAGTNNICIGFGTSLSGSGSATNYTWQPGGLFGSTVSVTPTSTTIFTVTGVSSNGCVIKNTITINVNNPPIISITPSNTTICLNTFANLSASGGIGSYTWQPFGTFGANQSFSPITATTYTAFGISSFGCIGSNTALINVNSLPVVNCNSSNSLTCPNASLTLSATGANTYTWFPQNVISAVTIVSPSVSTNYTVVGISVLGCTNSCIVSQSVYPTSVGFFTLVATPSVICTSPSSNSTLSVIGVSNYTWLPTNTTNTSIVVNTPNTYTASSTYTNNCIYTNTLELFGTDAYASLGSTEICNTSTLDLYSLSSLPSGGSFSVNGAPSSNIISLPTGTYAIAFTYTAGILCNNSAVTTITVLPAPANPTISTSAVIACANGNLTLTATPFSVYGYTWQPIAFVGNPAVFTPTAGQIYTVQTGPSACMLTQTINIDLNPIPCDCLSGCTTTLSTSLSNTNVPPNTSYCVLTDIYISGAVTFSNSDFKIAPNLTITVLPSSTLTIYGSHLYACDNMWQGIVVNSGGVLNIVNSVTNTSFIEDAFIAVDCPIYTLGTPLTNILRIQNATFNQNQISIRIADYNFTQVTYPYTIQNCLFTSRTIPYSTLTWLNTNTIKNSASGNSSPLQTPYINNISYPFTNLKAPLSGQNPNNGIVLLNVGYTTASANVFRSIVIGNAINTASFNCFDNLREDITAINSNVTIINNVFQNGVRFGRGGNGGGKAIVATSKSFGDGLSTPNNQILIQGIGTTSILANRFYEKTACAVVVGYISTKIYGNQAFSFANAYSGSIFLNPIGATGFSVKTNRYITMNLQNNNIYNIKNAMLISMDVGTYFVASNSGFGRLVGNIIVTNNIVNRHPTTAISNEFVNIGLSIADPFAASASTQIIWTGSSSSNISNNRFINVHNGVAVSNVNFSGVGITNNTITMVNEPNIIFGAPIQNGIVANQLGNAAISINNITGPASYTNEISAIKTSMNKQLAVRCNSTANTYHGLNFNASQAITAVEDNLMQNQKYGISLTNTATIGQQGNIFWPTNNQWLGTTWSTPTLTTGNYKTMNQDASSSAQSSKMYASWTSTPSIIDPNLSSFLVNAPGSTPGLYNNDDYFHQTGSGINTILNPLINLPTGCRLGTSTVNINGIFANAQRFLMENLVTNATPIGTIANETRMIDKNRVYQTLRSNGTYTTGSSVLTTFYSSALTSVMQTLEAIENDFYTANNIAATNKIASLSTSNIVEANYKTFYSVYLKTKDSTYNSMDSTNLINLANTCPYNNGGVVYQARALYNTIYDTYIQFADNCNLGMGSRMFDNVVKPEDAMEINVILKSKLFPNPNTGNFIISITNLKEDKNVEVYVYDITGKLIMQEVKIVNENLINFNSALTNGMYLVKLKLPDGSVDVHRIIIEK